MEWTEEAIAQLRALWHDGHSTAEIGRRMGVTKNAIVGKAHRLHLSSRPSPIRRDRSSDPRPHAPRPHRASTRRAPSESPASPPKPALRAVPAVAYGRVSPCCWPIGEPGTRSFHFCDDGTLPNKPYCAAHAQLAYVKVRDKRETAA